jgi:transaldolase
VRIFLDSSKISEVEKWDAVIDGATTNPSILLKEGNTDIYKFAKTLGDRPVSIEATGDFVTEAKEYAKRIPNAVIKIPLLSHVKGQDNMKLIKQLSDEGIKINCTALFSLSQVILAAKCGARYVSLFAGRIEDEGGCSPEVIEDCMQFIQYEGYGLKGGYPELIVGSIRTVGNVMDAVNAGASILTITPDVLAKMIYHERSYSTVLEFEEAGKKLKAGVK